MSADRSETALRRLVAQFSKLRQEDIEAILAELSSEDRRAVEALTSNYRGVVTPGPSPKLPAVSPEPTYDIDGLSPWLNTRLRAESGASAAAFPETISGAQTGMTQTAVAALRSSATEMLKLGLAAPRPPELPSASNSLLRRLGAALLPGWSSE